MFRVVLLNGRNSSAKFSSQAVFSRLERLLGDFRDCKYLEFGQRHPISTGFVAAGWTVFLRFIPTVAFLGE